MTLSSHDTEAAVLAAVIDPKLNAWAAAAELGVTVQTFTDRRHASLWVLACRVTAAGGQIDAFTVYEEATRTTMGELWDAMRGRPGQDDPATGQASEWVTLAWLSDLGSVRAPVAQFRRNAASLVALADQLALRERSIGMTSDLDVAVQEGSTMIRVGSALFGPRPAR